MSSPLCNSLTVMRRILNRRIATSIWILSLLGVFMLSHLALLRLEKTRNLNDFGYPNSTIERLFQKLMISDHSICGDACVTRNDSDQASENETASGDLTSRNENDDKNLVTSESALRDDEFVEILLPERDEVNHPDQYQKDFAKRLSLTWTEEKSEAQKELFRQRSSAVQEKCHSMKLSGALSPKMAAVFSNMRWITKYNMIWCPVFKAASTNWVKNLLIIAGESKIYEKSLHARVRELYGPPEDPRIRNKLLKENLKMLIVRHPLERILSAYRDKMLRVRHPHDPHVKIQQEILRLYPDPNAPSTTTTDAPKSNKGKMPTTHPTFTQFLMKVRDDLQKTWTNNGKTIVNMHWRPFWLTCAPCHIHYDFIAKVETLDLDQEYIIREMGLQDVLYNARTHSSNFDSYNTTSDAAKDYFKEVPLSLLKDIVKLYKPDFTLFDYSPDLYLKIAKTDK